MDERIYLVVFWVEGKRYAFPLEYVQRVIRAVEITALPEAPDVIAGIINVQGEIVPVINLRRRLKLADRDIDVNDQFMLIRFAESVIALIIDSVEGAIEIENNRICNAREFLPDTNIINRVVKDTEGMILLFDPEKILSLSEAAGLHTALADPQTQLVELHH